VIDKEKLSDLRACCAVLMHYPGSDTARTEAAALARELFPPMAKALVWDDGSGGVWFAGIYSVIDHGEGRFKAVWAKSMALFSSLAEAKAACEAHHQARFLEMCA